MSFCRRPTKRRKLNDETSDEDDDDIDVSVDESSVDEGLISSVESFDINPEPLFYKLIVIYFLEVTIFVIFTYKRFIMDCHELRRKKTEVLVEL